MKGPRPGLSASAAFDSRGTLWCVNVEGDHVVVRNSRDQGHTWSTPVQVNATPEPVESDGDSRRASPLVPRATSMSHGPSR